MKFRTPLIIITSIVMLWSLISLIIGYQESDAFGVILSVLVFLVGIMVLTYITKYSRKSLYADMIITSTFENGLYEKLEPVLSSIGDVGVSLENVNNRIDKIDYKLNNALTQTVPVKLSKSRFTITTILLVNVSLAVIVFLSLNPLAGTHYILALVYLAWWIHITQEFEMFNNTKAWYYCFVIIVTIPILTIIINAVINMRVMMGILFSGIAVFAIVYYTWANYTKSGKLPFNIHNDIRRGIAEIQRGDGK